MRKIICIAAIFGTMLGTEAAVVSWSAEQIAASGTAQISNNGTFVEAGVFGTNALTLGGVTFERMYYTADYIGQTYFHSESGQNLLAGTWVTGTYSVGVNPDYANLFERDRYTGGPDTALTFSNLSVGQDYEVQIFVADMRGISALWDRVVQMDGTVFNTDGWIATGGDDSGAIMTGTFTADATTQDFVMNIYDLSSAAPVSGWTLSAYQIRAVPEPATIGLFGISSVLLLALRRRLG